MGSLHEMVVTLGSPGDEIEVCTFLTVMHLPVQNNKKGKKSDRKKQKRDRERTKRDGEAGEAAKEAEEAEGKERRDRREKKKRKREREQEKKGDIFMNGFHKMVLFLVVQSFFWIRANVLTPISLP